MTDEKTKPKENRTPEMIWGELRRRLEAAQLATERGPAPTAEEKRRALQARAQALAREPETNAPGGECLEVVEFLLSDEKYAIETACVREIYPCRELTPLPCTPPFVRGITNVRGQILSVIDIRTLFGLPQRDLTHLNRVIIARTSEVEVGILADAVLGVRSIPASQIQPPLPTLSGVRAEYLRGVAGDRLAVLDGAKILSDKRIIVHDEVGM